MKTTKLPLIWLNVLLFSSTFLVAIVAMPFWAYFHGFDWIQVTMFLVAYCFCGLSITAGYHRLWCHRAYLAHPVLKYILAVGGAFAMQNSILHWSSDHRRHHRYVDDHNNDPYCAKCGFWYSHIGWMLRHYQREKYHDYSKCQDLQKDPIVMWQHRYYVPLALITNISVPIIFGLLHGDIWGAIILIGATRVVANHHCTFFINSLAHLWGSQPYNQKNTARDNGFLALFTFGEGYHNFHHVFESDYRNGIHWWQFDPTKWLIKLGSWAGLTERLRITPVNLIEKARATVVLKHIRLHLSLLPNTAHRLQIIEQEYDALVSRMGDYYGAKKRLMGLNRKKLLKKYEQAILIQQLRVLKSEFKKQKQSWLTITASYA